MHKKILILISFLIINNSIATSYKPALPQGAYRTQAVPLNCLDMTLNVRPFTIVDKLNEVLEDYQLNPTQANSLRNFNGQQEAIIAAIKPTYLVVIEEYKKRQLNRSLYVQFAIAGYRAEIKKAVNANLEEDINNFLKELNYTRRRQRE